MTELICILCPKGCHLKVDEANGFSVSGNSCEKGEGYGKKELCNPTRTVTSTVVIEGGHIPRMPVKTSGEIPKKDIMPAMRLLNDVRLAAPVKAGHVVAENILGNGVNFVATRSIDKL